MIQNAVWNLGKDESPLDVLLIGNASTQPPDRGLFTRVLRWIPHPTFVESHPSGGSVCACVNPPFLEGEVEYPHSPDASQCGDWDLSRPGLEAPTPKNIDRSALLLLITPAPTRTQICMQMMCCWSAKTVGDDDRIFDWEKETNGEINTRTFAGFVVLACDSEYSFGFLFT